MSEHNRDRLIAALEDALNAYKRISAVEGRALAAHAAFSYLMSVGIELRLLAPLGELATQNQRERDRMIGNTAPTPDVFRRVLGAVAVTAIFEHAKMGRSLNEIAKEVAKHLGGIEPKALIHYRKELLGFRKGEDAKKLYDVLYDAQLKPELKAALDAIPNASERDIEKSILLLIEPMCPIDPAQKV
jgi:hypothetical protein